jgi:hypothetical protein
MFRRRPSRSVSRPLRGEALRPDEVDWLDDITTECTYCGNPVREDN